MHIKNKRGQSTVEYVLLVTAVVAVMIGFVANNNAGGLQSQLNSTLGSAANEMNSMAAGFSNSHVMGSAAANAYGVPVNPSGN